MMSLHTTYPPVVGVAWATEVRAPENPIWVAGERAGSIPARRPGTSAAAHWANYLGELVRELPLHYPSWRQVPAEQKAGVMARIGTQFDMRPHMESDRWPLIYAAIQQHLQKIYNGKKAALKERHWIPDSDGTYDLERIRLSRPSTFRGQLDALILRQE
ncbi:hypothetical protein Tco_0507608 [Tanacetum coccineum]